MVTFSASSNLNTEKKQHYLEHPGHEEEAMRYDKAEGLLFASALSSWDTGGCNYEIAKY